MYLLAIILLSIIIYFGYWAFYRPKAIKKLRSKILNDFGLDVLRCLPPYENMCRSHKGLNYYYHLAHMAYVHSRGM